MTAIITAIAGVASAALWLAYKRSPTPQQSQTQAIDHEQSQNSAAIADAVRAAKLRNDAANAPDNRPNR